MFTILLFHFGNGEADISPRLANGNSPSPLGPDPVPLIVTMTHNSYYVKCLAKPMLINASLASHYAYASATYLSRWRTITLADRL